MMDITKHFLWESWECIPTRISKGKWRFIMLFMTFVDCIVWRIYACLDWALSADSDYCMVSFFRYFFKYFFYLKSDTAVALRRSGSKIPCITVVSFNNDYYEYSCKLMWLSAKSKDVLELLDVRRQCKLWFLDINMNFTEQNIHVLCNMKSSVIWVSSHEEHQRLVIHLIYISAFCESSLWLEKWLCYSVNRHSPNNRLVCFRRKAFLKSDTVAGFPTSVFLKWCKIHVCLRNFNYGISVV